MLNTLYLLEALYDEWFVNTMKITRDVLMILVMICALAIVVCICLQTNNARGGTNVVTGITESYYAQNRGNTREGRLKRITIICSIALVVMVLLIFIPRILGIGF